MRRPATRNEQINNVKTQQENEITRAMSKRRAWGGRQKMACRQSGGTNAQEKTLSKARQTALRKRNKHVKICGRQLKFVRLLARFVEDTIHPNQWVYVHNFKSNTIFSLFSYFHFESLSRSRCAVFLHTSASVAGMAAAAAAVAAKKNRRISNPEER